MPLRIAHPPARRLGSSVPLIVLLALAATSCARAPREVVLTGDTMGTTYTVKYITDASVASVARVERGITAILAQIDLELSTYRADSALARFNASRTRDWIDVPLHLAAAVASAREVSEWSAGSFDITAAPLVDAWGFGSQPRSRPPTTAAVARMRERVGYRRLHVELDPPRLRKETPLLQVDVNGIAPGFTVDLVAADLQRQGISDYLVEIGGEVAARGKNLRGEAWRVAIERPLENERHPYAIVALDAMAVSTSGDYRHYLDYDGRHYSHIIDARSGYPLDGPLTSVVVISDRAARADALSTALAVLGSEEGYRRAVAEGIAALFLLREGRGLRELATPAFARYRMESRAGRKADVEPEQ